ncbi:hypothetical protein CTI14_63630 [Methylobacterium radiotolerans]|nr:hypothetical protein CTI14_63630 [Methylobacterium radiotolerans]
MTSGGSEVQQPKTGSTYKASEYFERAVNLGMPTMNDLYRQEAFEAWTRSPLRDVERPSQA